MNPVRTCLLPLLVLGMLAVASLAFAQTMGDPPVGCGAGLAPIAEGGSATATTPNPLLSFVFSGGVGSAPVFAATVSSYWLVPSLPAIARLPLAPARALPIKFAANARRIVR